MAVPLGRSSDSDLQIAGMLLNTKGSVAAQTENSLLPLRAVNPERILRRAEAPE